MQPAHVVIAPDSFKGSLSAHAVAEALAAGLSRRANAPAITIAPMADGGEGLLDAIAACCEGEWLHASLTGIHKEPVAARRYRMHDGTTVIESAEVLGLPLIESSDTPPALADRGSGALGALIAAALDDGAESIAIGLGGSATNDAGLGLLMALGAQAYDAEGNAVAPTMAGLLQLDRIDLGALDPRLARIRIRALCDVDNPLLGDNGASRIYGPQKGLSASEISAVEAAFARLARAADAEQASRRAGSGAAGGLGFALALLGGALESGASAVIELTGLADKMKQATAVITGEGRADRQTLSGKLPMAIAAAAGATPTHLVAGSIPAEARDALAEKFASLSSLVDTAGSLDAALESPAHWLAEIGEALGPRL